MPVSHAEQLIADLGSRMGIPGLRLGAAGTCQLVFDQRWVVTVVADGRSGRIALHCPLCTPQQADQLPARTLRHLLEANFMGHGTAGALLSAAPDHRVYLQLQLLPQEAADGGLHNALEQLLNLAETWATRLDRDLGQPEPVAALPVHAPPAWAMQRV